MGSRSYRYRSLGLIGGLFAGLLLSCGTATPDPMWEIAFSHFVTRSGGTLPETQKLVLRIRPTGSDHHMVWETLTHASVGDGK